MTEPGTDTVRIPARILVVEDEEKLAHALQEGLTAEGFDVATALSGEDGFFRGAAEPFDLLILDWMLPQRSGLEVLEALRKNGARQPVLLLTARDTVADRVSGLNAGADDYLTKPFAFSELIARVHALLRRGRSDSGRRLALRDLELDRITRVVTRGGRRLDVTLREFELLAFLLLHQGQVVSREMLAKEVWQEPARVATLDNVIDVTIARLRKKVDADQPVRLIHTVRGVGFVMREEPA